MAVKWLDRTILVAPHMTLCLSERDFKSALRHCEIVDYNARWVTDGCDGTTHTFTYDTSRIVCVVCLRPRGYVLTELIGIITHEARHVVDDMANHYGGMNFNDPELAAESVQVITQRLFEDLLRQLGREDKLPRKLRK